ncbi:hypothetical protein V6Z12_D13G051200 [Gossypium hirsutum]
MANSGKAKRKKKKENPPITVIWPPFSLHFIRLL